MRVLRCITDRRASTVPVFQILRMMANGDSMDMLLREFPNLERADILACLDYASFVVEGQAEPYA